jgi:ABC-type Fe3+ transport system substrate-binding protein
VKLIRELFVLNQVAILCLTSLILAVLTPSTPLLAGEKLTIYSGRAERLIKPVLDEFTSKTGIQVDLLSSGTTELVNRLKAEGDRTAADLFLTNDAGSLEQARTAGVLRPLNMREVDRAVPPQFRAPDNAWIGLSGRFWIIVYNKTSQIVEAVAKGQVALGIVNHYYIYRHLAAQPSAPIAAFMPDQQEGGMGAIMNVAGIGIVKTTKHLDSAKLLVEFLVAQAGQKLFADLDKEYPLHPDVKADPALIERKSFRAAQVPLTKLAELREPTLILIEQVGLR